MLVGLRGLFPDWALVVLANWLLLLSPVLLYEGIRQFRAKPHRSMLHYALIALLLYVVMYTGKNRWAGTPLMKKWILVNLVFILTMVSCNPLASKTNPGVAIYLTTSDVKAKQLSNLDLHTVPINRPAFISMDDILAYSKESYEFTLTATACKKIQQLVVPVQGRPFVVYVGDEPIYYGAFWTVISSISFDGPTIEKTVSCLDQPTIKIQPGYPGPNFYKGEDKRSDPRILQALDKAGKLK